MNSTICFIGAGNMASALIGGLIAAGYPAKNLRACDPFQQSLEKLNQEFPELKTFQNNEQGLADADVVVLAIKPQILKQVLQPLAILLQTRKPLLVSIAAGITQSSINTWAGGNMPVVRCMPNTPALVQQGASALFANNNCSEEQKQLAQQILEAVGSVVWVEKESLLDVVTAVSGSGPAYFFLLMETIKAAGESLGLSSETAEQLTLQTALGAASMAKSSDVDVAELRRRVTSPNGTTEAAINSFIEQGLPDIVQRALQAANDRSEELAKELGD